MVLEIGPSDSLYVHLFRTPGFFYLYNAHTNAIAELDEVTWHSLHRQISSLQESDSDETSNVDGLLMDVLLGCGLRVAGGPTKLRAPWSHEQLISELQSTLSHLTLCVTEACNLRCEYCIYGENYTSFRRHSLRTMPRQIARRAIDFFLEHCKCEESVTLGFYGGEPLINAALIQECLEMTQIRRKGAPITFTLTTNGTLLTSEIVDLLQRYQVSLLVSLDGPQPVHDRCRCAADGGGTFSLIVQNLARMREQYPDYYRRQVGLNVVLAPGTDPNAVHEFFRSRPELCPSKQVSVSYVIPYATTVFEKLAPDGQPSTDRLRQEFKELAVQERLVEDPFLEIFFGRPLLKLHKRQHWDGFSACHYPNGICFPGQRKLFVDVDGQFHLCERVGETRLIGNVEQGFDYDAIWHLIQEYIRIREPDCLNCWAIRLCDTCFVSVFNGEDDAEARRRVCQNIRADVSASLQLYCEVLEQNPRAFEYMKDIVLS